MDEERKQTVLARLWCNLPENTLQNFISEGEITFAEMENAVNVYAVYKEDESKKNKAERNLNAIRVWVEKQEERIEEASWLATDENDIESYIDYLTVYPDGIHANEAKDYLRRSEDDLWKNIIEEITDEKLRLYKQLFPTGEHIDDCNDKNWLKAKIKNTIEGYEDYHRNFPDKHVKDINKAINDLNDDEDWREAYENGTSDDYRHYLQNHPEGQHSADATNNISALASHDEVIAKLQDDLNFLDALKIQEYVRKKTLSWEEISSIYGEDIRNAIENYKSPPNLPGNNDPKNLSERLKEGNTEVYFWGYRGSGKTCVVGSVISSLCRQGNLKIKTCPGYDYMTRLSNIFNHDEICSLPPGTENSNIQEMVMTIRDEHKYEHRVTLVDLAGELIEIAYKKGHPESSFTFFENDFQSLDKALGYLRDQRNEKIHFFVVEYDSHTKKIGPDGGYSIQDLLDNMITLLSDNKIFGTTTVGVYVLVTKSDKIFLNAQDDVAKLAYDYVNENYKMFWNNIQVECKKTGIKDLGTIAFNIGKVYAQNLCIFNDSCANKIIKKLIDKTIPYGKDLWSNIKEFFRS